MSRFGLCCVVLALSCGAFGCGGSDGLEPGLPKDTAAPANPTPDMGPVPAKDAPKMP